MTPRPDAPHLIGRRLAALVVALVTILAGCGSAASPAAPSPATSVPSGTSVSLPTSVASPTPSASRTPEPRATGTAATSTAAARSSTPSATPFHQTSPSLDDCASFNPLPTAPPTTTPADGAQPPKIELQPVVSGLSAPLGIVSPRDGSGRLFIVEQEGLIRIVKDGAILDRPFLDLRGATAAGGERGLLGLAFHPGYGCDGRFYVDYTDSNGDTVVAEYRVSASDPNVADPKPLARLLHIAQPFANHNGGELQFGPDGDLYVGMGDGGSGGDPMGNGQRLDTLLGKLLRLDVDHRAPGSPPATPADNCRGCPGKPLPEIDAYGLRNPWRFSFDRATGDLWLADVGQGTWEEIDHIRPDAISGANFGWNVMEGDHCYPPGSSCSKAGITLPVAEYDHSQGDCSISGGYVSRGTAFPTLAGWYLFSDYCTGRIRALSTAAGASPVVVLETGGSIATFGEDESADLYVADIAKGTLSKIVPGS